MSAWKLNDSERYTTHLEAAKCLDAPYGVYLGDGCERNILTSTEEMNRAYKEEKFIRMGYKKGYMDGYY